MSDSENKSEKRGNGDENRQIPLDEREWDALLRRATRETRLFLQFYEKSFSETSVDEAESDFERLDECARSMGWQTGPEDAADNDVPAAEPLGLDEPLPESEAREHDDVPAAEPLPFPDVYSLHNVPECIAVGAICRYASSRLVPLVKYVPEAGNFSTLRAVISLTETLNTIRRDLMLAVDAEDSHEFGLAVCLTKRAHSALNRYFADFAKLTEKLRGPYEIGRARKIRCALMDLRDICLRILRDSRAELEKKHD